jgi:hypothetical protein
MSPEDAAVRSADQAAAKAEFDTKTVIEKPEVRNVDSERFLELADYFDEREERILVNRLVDYEYEAMNSELGRTRDIVPLPRGWITDRRLGDLETVGAAMRYLPSQFARRDSTVDADWYVIQKTGFDAADIRNHLGGNYRWQETLGTAPKHTPELDSAIAGDYLEAAREFEDHIPDFLSPVPGYEANTPVIVPNWEELNYLMKTAPHEFADGQYICRSLGGADGKVSALSWGDGRVFDARNLGVEETVEGRVILMRKIGSFPKRPITESIP